MKTEFKVEHPQYHDLFTRIKNFLAQDQVTYSIDNEIVHGYRSPDCDALWIRDHSDILRGARYFEQDMLSGVSHFAATQRANGSIFDFVSCAMDRENWTKYVRVPVEADVEYRFVKAIFLGWQATGNDEWLQKIIIHAERAMNYSMTHPWRWSKKYGLLKRAYTMDTWDFDYVSENQSWLNFQITDKTHWGIFHGDNSGFFEACKILGKLFLHLGDANKAQYWNETGEKIKKRTHELCWNGRFFTHRIPLDDFSIQGVDAAEQLSFSNPAAINRGLATHEMAVAMIQEYQKRKLQSNTFAEWFSMDPPFPDGSFGDPKLIGGAYINGGIMPLVGGELARAAFEHGFETYGHSILTQYAEMIQKTNETYLWYFPNGQPSSDATSTSPEATPTDGWGSSAMLYAFIEGLAGVVDQKSLFQEVKLSPRWSAAGIEKAEVQVGYGSSNAGIEYDYSCEANSCQLVVAGHATLRGGMINLHLLLPKDKSAKKVLLDEEVISFKPSMVEQSQYVDLEFRLDGKMKVEVQF